MTHVSASPADGDDNSECFVFYQKSGARITIFQPRVRRGGRLGNYDRTMGLIG